MTKSILTALLCGALLGALFGGSALHALRPAPAAAAAIPGVADLGPDEILYGPGGKKQMLRALKARVRALAELEEAEDDHVFFLACAQLMAEMGTVIGGRRSGVRGVGMLDVSFDSFRAGADEWKLEISVAGRVPDGHPLADVDPASLTIPKGRFVKYITAEGLLDAEADLAGIDDYVVFVGFEERAALVYPNLRFDRDPWVVWLPAREIDEVWDRPPLPGRRHR